MSILLRVPVYVISALVVGALCASCANPNKSGKQAVEQGTASSSAVSSGAQSPSSSSVSPEPAVTTEPAGTDPSSNEGTFGPLPADTDTSSFMPVAEVQQTLLVDGASTDWVKPSATLKVKEGQYIANTVPQTLGSTVPSVTPGQPVAAYEFSGNSGTCPESGGGSGPSGAAPPSPSDVPCKGTVMADAMSGKILFVQTYGT